MAGHRKRKNNEALIRRSLMSGRPRLLHSCLHDANTSFSSRGKTLHKKKNTITRSSCLECLVIFNLSNSQQDFQRCNTTTVFAEGLEFIQCLNMLMECLHSV